MNKQEEEQEEQTDDSDDSSDDLDPDFNSDGTFTIKLFNSPIIQPEGLAGSFVKFGSPQSTEYENTNDAEFQQQNFVTPQNINIKAKMMGSVNTFIGFFDDPGFQQPSFDPQPDNDQNKQVFVNGNRNFYVKVESDM